MSLYYYDILKLKINFKKLKNKLKNNYYRDIGSSFIKTICKLKLEELRINIQNPTQDKKGVNRSSVYSEPFDSEFQRVVIIRRYPKHRR
jgi:hypothetical protein